MEIKQKKGFLKSAALMVLSSLVVLAICIAPVSASLAYEGADAALPASIAGGMPKELIPLGIPVGIKMYSVGVMIAGLSPVETENGEKQPAYAAGIKPGDIISEVNGKAINTGEELEARIRESEGGLVILQIFREDKKIEVKLHPERSAADGCYRIGAWVRDSMAGIGTISFVDPKTGRFGALGHAICDVDSGKLMPLRTGSIMPATVVDVKKGMAGIPGELRGAFDLKRTIGTLRLNSEKGIFGIMTDSSVYSGLKALPIAPMSEVEPGKAEIVTTVSGKEPKTYEVTILKVNREGGSPEKNMVIQVSDSRLLSITGGIVQGMSGSPIVQNGKIIGAVTHVLVGDPAKGYGIFIENMLHQSYSEHQIAA